MAITTKETSNINLHIGEDSNVKVWLVDPTYTQQQLSSYAMPSAIGGIATFTDQYITKLKTPVRVFKFPEKMMQNFSQQHFYFLC